MVDKTSNVKVRRSIGGKKVKSRTVGDVLAALMEGAAPDKRALGTIADGLNAQFERVEAVWGKKYSAGASITLINDRETMEVISLAFRRRGAGWELLLDDQHAQDTDGEHIVTTPLKAAPLILRVKAAQALEELEARLEDEMGAQARRLAKTLTDLTAFADRLEQGKSS